MKSDFETHEIGGTMQFASADLTTRQAHRLLTGAVSPRPVAWITSLSPDGVVNLAPFSAFTLVCPDPPMVGFAAGSSKDTCKNVEQRGEFVINIARFRQLDDLHESSRELPPNESEADHLGLSTIDSVDVSTPRLTDVPISLECRVAAVYRHGRLGTRFIVGEVTRFHVADDLLRDGASGDWSIDPLAVDPIAVLTGGEYARIERTRSLRPVHGTRNPWGVTFPERIT